MATKIFIVEDEVMAQKSLIRLLSQHFPDFDAWLSGVETNPYEIDQAGNPRNPGKLQPGSWDPGL